ncbi:restriction endonuclease subunit S [Treponema succinifaciens]|uniref:restriction endonuclease subunit S n=1 Tax=Treponema succinifaciens TaxID=167 RepID=UPI0023F3F2E3|nr:restriction endonuclease subunit S [Treponema succinifaciens]
MKKYKLGEIAEINASSIKSSDKIDEILYLDTANITENRIDTLQRFGLKKAPSRAQRKVKDNTIIFSTVRPNQSHFGIMKNPASNLIVSSGFATLDIKNPDEFNADYLYYNLTQPFIVNYLQTVAQNQVSSYPSINPSDLANLNLSFPPFSEQKKIASVLSSLDEKIALNNRINEKLEQLAKRLYDYWFVQFDFPNSDGKPYKSSGGKMVYNAELKREIPEGWEVVLLKDCISNINTGLNPRDNFKLGNGTIKYITVKNLTENGNIDFSNCDIIDENARDLVHNRSEISIGDILFASICPLRRCYLIRAEPKTWDINESVFSIRPNSKKITSQFLYCILKDSYYVNKMSQIATGSIFKGIRINDLEKLPVLLPSESLIDLFTQKTISIFNYQLSIEQESAKLTALRDKLLPLLMNGQVEII